MDEKRNLLLKQFLTDNNFTYNKIQKVAGDASFRSYYRIFSKNNSFILMDAPPEFEDIKPFIKIDEFLRSNSITAPEILLIDHKNGFMIMEDFGDLSLTKHLAKYNNEKLTEEEFKIYNLACKQLINVQNSKINVELPLYDEKLLLKEVMLFPDWYLPHIAKKTLDASALEDFKQIWLEIFKDLSKPSILVLRDYHADNLMIASKYKGHNQIGLLDFQDAVIGHLAYDLASLLDDARRDLNEANRHKLINYYLEESKKFDTNIDEKQFLHEYDLLSLQRNVKIIGIFARLAVRDKKPAYLNYLPRIFNYVKIRGNGSSFKEIKKFLSTYIT